MSEERKTVLLTGASRGIGHATVKRFSDAEWRVITVSREHVPADCKRNPFWTHHLTADLADPEQRAALIRFAPVLLGTDRGDWEPNSPSGRRCRARFWRFCRRAVC